MMGLLSHVEPAQAMLTDGPVQQSIDVNLYLSSSLSAACDRLHLCWPLTLAMLSAQTDRDADRVRTRVVEPTVAMEVLGVA